MSRVKFFMIFLLLLSPVLAQGVLSGEYTAYENPQLGFKVKLPAEFKVNTEGPVTMWDGPVVVGSIVTSSSVNVVHMPGVAPQVMYDANVNSHKNNPAYAEITPIKVKGGAIDALLIKESDKGKDDDSIHRWHVVAWANDRQYLWGFAGNLGAFKKPEVIKAYETMIGSIELVPPK